MWYVSEKNIHASLTSKDIACYLLGVVCNIILSKSVYVYCSFRFLFLYSESLFYECRLRLLPDVVVNCQVQ